MQIYSVPTATTAYRLDIPEIGRDYFIPAQKVLENEFIATSTAPAGFFRQLIKYDLSSVRRNYRLILDLTRATELQNMIESDQTTFYCSTLGRVYEINLTGTIAPAGKLRAVADIQISVVARLS